MIGRKKIFLVPLSAILIIAGCGGGSQDQPVLTQSFSQHCIDCHSTNERRISSVNGEPITDQWLRSPHNTESPANKGGTGAGCPNCHAPSHQHPDDCAQCHGGSSSVTASFVNPDNSLNCDPCHAPNSNIKPLGAPHFNNFTSVSHQAQYADSQNRGRCRNCHNPHDNVIIDEQREWSESGHGNVDSPAWSTEDFKEDARCLRCHTGNGYINYISSSPPFVLPSSPLAADRSYGVLGCNACHASYDFDNSLRQVESYTAPYNGGSSPQSFPAVGSSNICVPCHSGRESGDTVNAVADFTNVSFKNSHYMAAAGLMYMKNGFVSFVAPDTPIGTSTYGLSFTPDDTVPGGATGGVRSTHRRLGTTGINGDNHNPSFFVSGVLDENGPCVTCHFNGSGVPARSGGHRLEISPQAFQQVCGHCHTSELGVTLTADNFREVFVEPQAEVFENALSLAIAILESNYGIRYDQSRFPYFYDITLDPSAKSQVKDWTRGSGNQDFGRKIMGACFNINLLKREPAAFAHARTYSRRLIYDTIDFLDNGNIDLSTGNTATTLFPSVYGKNPTSAFTDGSLTTLAPGTTESMVFLIGWSRGTGLWSSLERP